MKQHTLPDFFRYCGSRCLFLQGDKEGIGRGAKGDSIPRMEDEGAIGTTADRYTSPCENILRGEHV